MERAVVSFSEGTVKSLIGKLGSVLANEALLLGGVSNEIQYIKDELESMNAFLIIQAQKEDPDHQVKIWMKQVREMAYDAEDCIDRFRCRIDKPRGNTRFAIIYKSVLLLRTLKARHQIATKIQGLRTRTREVSERQQRYHVPANGSSKITSSAGDPLIPYPQLQALYPEQVQPVGFDDCRNEIIGWLMDENRPQLTIISIVGFGGLGKTTLARMAYQSPIVKAGNFECRAFVAVTQRFDVKQLLIDIFRQIQQISNKGSTMIKTDEILEKNDKEEEQRAATRSLEIMAKWDGPTLISKLREYLNNRRYVIIVDDIWAVSAWEHFKVALPDSTNGSRIIVTTRIESVAYECSRDNNSYVYKMKPLDDKSSKRLFYKRISGTNYDLSLGNDLDQVSSEILKKCGGMPLAINSVAGLLASKPKQPEKWKKILNSLGSELETNPTLEGMKKILSLSYHDLPHYLKTCFLYLSIYPEDYKIRRKKLTRRWIAEGFVDTKRGMSADEVAESYFYELVNRSMVVPIDISNTGEIKNIQVHDVMLEIIVSKSLEENFVSLVGGEYNLTHDKIRRLSVHSFGQENDPLPSININLAHIRSLTIFGNSKKWFKSKHLRLVRVLDLDGNKAIRDGHLKYLCKMFQLKYLSLRQTYIGELPSKIRKLQNLETLDIRDTYIRKLPSDIVELQKLTHLYGGKREYNLYSGASGMSMVLPRGVTKLKNIQTLTQVYLNCSVIHGLGELSHITKLGFIFPDTRVAKMEEKAWRSLCSVLENLSVSLKALAIWLENERNNSLQLLNLLKSPPTLLRSLDLLGNLEKLPHWFSSLNNLTELKLYETCLHEDDFGVIQTLPNLLCLHQTGGAYNIEELVFVEKGFPSLRVFLFEDFKIPVLQFKERAAPKLEKLVITFMFELKTFYGIKYLQSLKEIALKVPKFRDVGTVINDLKTVTDPGLNKFEFTVEYY